MKLACVYNIFDGLELLPYSVKNMAPCVDGFIFVYQDVSNHGETQNTGEEVYRIAQMIDTPVAIVLYEPNLNLSPTDNERKKREIGLNTAKRMGFTHFMDVDCDEFYHPEELLKEKQRVISKNLNGLVCRSQVYFKSPCLTIGNDFTLVPIIQKIDTTHLFNRNYPFAFTDLDGVPFTPKKRIRIDPTRQLDFTSGVEWSEIKMYHMSWVRKDINLKIRNSSARVNIEGSTVLNDWLHAKDGYFCEFYGKYLTSCPNAFGLPEWNDLKTTSGDNP